MKIDKRGLNTILVTLILVMIGVVICYTYGWLSLKGIFGWLSIMVGLMNLLGLMMDLYFKKKYGKETLEFGKETFPVFFEKQKTYESQAWSSVQWRKIKGWFK